MATKLDHRDDVVSARINEAIDAAKAAPTPAMPTRSPELAAHFAKIARQTAQQRGTGGASS